MWKITLLSIPDLTTVKQQRKAAATTWSQWRYSADSRSSMRCNCGRFKNCWCRDSGLAAYVDWVSGYRLVCIAGKTDCIRRRQRRGLNQLNSSCHWSGWLHRWRIGVCNINWLSTDSNCVQKISIHNELNHMKRTCLQSVMVITPFERKQGCTNSFFIIYYLYKYERRCPTCKLV